MKIQIDKNIFNKLKEMIVHAKRNSHLNPLFAWKIILAIFLIGFICFAILGTLLFLRVQREDFEDNTTNTMSNIVGIKINQLKKVISYIDQKEINFQTILDSKNKTVDPSL